MADRQIERIIDSDHYGKAIEGVMEDGLQGVLVDVESTHRCSLHGIEARLYTGRSEFQKVDILRTPHLGKLLTLDEIIQVAQTDEHLYHELLVHPAACSIADPRSALVMGGGDGCAIRELLKYDGIRELQLVEIDAMVIEACKEHFADVNQGAFNHPRTRIIIDEAERRLRDGQSERLDLIIADLTEPYDLAGISGDLSKHIFSERFYGFVKSKLNPNYGVFVIQTGGVTFSEAVDRLHRTIISGLRKSFRTVKTLYQYIHSFDMIWTITLCSDGGYRWESFDPDPVLRKRGISGLRSYDRMSHIAACIAPRHIRDMFEG